MNVEVEILELFLNYSRTLSLTGTPQRKIAAAKWEIFFENQLSELKGKPEENGKAESASGV
jgi:hypothetical protein